MILIILMYYILSHGTIVPFMKESPQNFCTPLEILPLKVILETSYVTKITFKG